MNDNRMTATTLSGKNSKDEAAIARYLREDSHEG